VKTLKQLAQDRVHRAQLKAAKAIGQTWIECDPPQLQQTPTVSVGEVRAAMPRQILEHWRASPSILPLTAPAGCGKTFAFCQVARENPGASVILGAVTSEQRRKNAVQAGLREIRSLDESTCRLLKSGDRTPREVQERGHSVKANVCRSCEHRKRCAKDGHLWDLAELSRILAIPGPIRLSMTMRMIAVQAARFEPAALLAGWRRNCEDAALLDRAERERWHEVLLVLDEDLRQQVVEPVTVTRTWLETMRERVQFLEREGASLRSGSWGAHLALIEGIISQVNRSWETPRTSTTQAHGIEGGFSVPLDISSLAGPAAIVLVGISKFSGDVPTHPAEVVAVEKGCLVRRPPALWDKLIWAKLCRAIIQALELDGGCCWINVRRAGRGKAEDGSRDIVCYHQPTRLAALAAQHHTVQSDASADLMLWDPLWRAAAKGMGREAQVLPSQEWHVGRSLELWWTYERTYAENDDATAEALGRLILAAYRHEGAQLGVLTRKAIKSKLVDWLRVQKASVHVLGEDSPGKQAYADIVIGHYGAHDRATNDFEHCSALVLAGTYRVSTSEILKFTGWLQAQKVDIKPLPRLPGIPYHGITAEGRSFMRNGAAMQLDDPRANRVLQSTRTATVYQACERIRSVDRFDKGKPPVRVYLLGTEPVLNLPFPLARLVTIQDILALDVKEGEPRPQLGLNFYAERAVQEGATSQRQVVEKMRAEYGAEGDNRLMREAAKRALAKAKEAAERLSINRAVQHAPDSSPMGGVPATPGSRSEPLSARPDMPVDRGVPADLFSKKREDPVAEEVALFAVYFAVSRPTKRELDQHYRLNGYITALQQSLIGSALRQGQGHPRVLRRMDLACRRLRRLSYRLHDPGAAACADHLMELCRLTSDPVRLFTRLALLRWERQWPRASIPDEVGMAG
jgi:hypothetical protein